MTPTADTVTLYHNPNCGTSRNVLAAIQAAGHSPKVVEYLKAGWTRPQLQGLLAAMNLTPRDILRVRGTPAADHRRHDRPSDPGGAAHRGDAEGNGPVPAHRMGRRAALTARICEHIPPADAC